jgi:hypothetical protein
MTCTICGGELTPENSKAIREHADARICVAHVRAKKDAKIERLLVTLEWYASPRTWDQWCPDSFADKAREALRKAEDDESAIALHNQVAEKDAEIARLRKIIDKAPHERYCHPRRCDCWKSMVDEIEPVQ